MNQYKIKLYLNILAIRYFLKKGAQLTKIVYDILRKVELFKVKNRPL